MSAPTTGGQSQPGIDVLGSKVDPTTGSITLQTGDNANEFPETDGVELWQQPGWMSVPSNPDPKANACQAYVMRLSGQETCLGTRDVRSQKLAGNIQPGEFCAFAAGPNGLSQGRVFGKANGAVSLYTSAGNVAGGASVSIQNTPSGIYLSGPWGSISIDADGIKLATSDGAGIQLGSGNVTIIGKEIALNGGKVGLGANATIPVIIGPTGIAGVGSLSVSCSP